LDFPTRSDLFQVAKNAVIGTPGVTLDTGMVDVQGSDLNIICNVAADMGHSVLRQLVLSDRGRYLDSAVGAEIDRLGFDWYGLTRKQASAAIGAFQLTRASDSAGAGVIAAGSRVQFNATGAVFALTQGAMFGPTDLEATTTGPSSSSDIAGAAQLLGSASGVPATGQTGNTGWTWLDEPFDTTITIANAESFIGSDGEPVNTPAGDGAYKARIRAYFPSIQKGVLQAIVNGGLSVNQVSQAVAVEVTTPVVLPSVGLTEDQASAILQSIGTVIPFMYVDLYIVDVDGNSNSTMIGLVQQALISYRAAGVYVQVIGSIPQQVVVQQSGVSVPAGVDPVATAGALQAAIVNYINSLAANQSLQIPAIYAAELAAGTQASIPQGSLLIGVQGGVLGALDLTPTSGQTFRTSLPLVTVEG
jgi:hypothetical protein